MNSNLKLHHSVFFLLVRGWKGTESIQLIPCNLLFLLFGEINSILLLYILQSYLFRMIEGIIESRRHLRNVSKGSLSQNHFHGVWFGCHHSNVVLAAAGDKNEPRSCVCVWQKYCVISSVSFFFAWFMIPTIFFRKWKREKNVKISIKFLSKPKGGKDLIFNFSLSLCLWN